jgi:hypothetical protein
MLIFSPFRWWSGMGCGDLHYLVWSGYEPAAAAMQWALPYLLFTTMNTVLMSVMYADSGTQNSCASWQWHGADRSLLHCSSSSSYRKCDRALRGKGHDAALQVRRYFLAEKYPPSCSGGLGMGCIILVLSHFGGPGHALACVVFRSRCCVED